MDKLDVIGEAIRLQFEGINKRRDEALAQARLLTRDCATAVRAIHRRDWAEAQAQLKIVRQTVEEIKTMLADFPDLYYAGYTQDALREYVEAHLTYALVRDEPLPTPEELGVIPSTYVNGLAEASTELRRHILDIIRHDMNDEAERLMDAMDSIYMVLMTMDYSETITGGLRRRTDTLRSVLERTRGELTLSQQLHHLQQQIAEYGITEFLGGAATADYGE